MAAGDFLKARGILPFDPNAEDPAVTIRRMRDGDVLGMGAMLESMPDRAVVDERASAYQTVERWLKQVQAYNDIGAESLYGEPTYADPEEVMAWEEVLRALEPPDRAVVAISEDRQWLVVLHPGTERWVIHDLCHWGYQEHTTLEDTGQSAEDVLEAHLELQP